MKLLVDCFEILWILKVLLLIRIFETRETTEYFFDQSFSRNLYNTVPMYIVLAYFLFLT